MIDLLDASLDALARQDLGRLPLVALAGVATSVGPCVAPRYVAITALLHDAARPAWTTAAFVAGLTLAYAVLGFGVAVASVVWANASVGYALLAATLTAGGLTTLLRRPSACRHEHAAPLGGARLAQPFVLGALSACVVSPCCTPLLGAFAGLAAADRAPLAGAAFLGAFALGHATPLLFAGRTSAALGARLSGWSASGAAATVSGALMVALGGYYGLLV